MVYAITIEEDYLRADLFNRETAEESNEFFRIVADSALRHHRVRILISVRSSRAMFTVDRSGFLTHFEKIIADPSHKIALVADSAELESSHEYLELIGRLHRVNVRAFRDESSGIAWCRTKGQDMK